MGDLELGIRSGDWVLVVGAVLGVVLTGLQVMRRLETWQSSQLDMVRKSDDASYRARRMLVNKAFDIAKGAVTETWQEYVRGIKAAAADGKLRPDEKAEAVQRALDKIVEQGTRQGLDLLTDLGTPILKSMIEEAVGVAKRFGKGSAPPPAQLQ